MNDKDKGIKITTVGDNPHVTFVQHIVTNWPYVLVALAIVSLAAVAIVQALQPDNPTSFPGQSAGSTDGTRPGPDVSATATPILAGAAIPTSAPTWTPTPTPMPAPTWTPKLASFEHLVAWWRAEGTALDSIQGASMVLYNGARFGEGKVGQGFLFDGKDDYAGIPFGHNLFPSAYSVAAWVNPLSPVDDPEKQELIVGQGRGGYSLVVTQGKAGLVVGWLFSKGKDSFEILYSKREIPIGSFSHIVGTWDGNTLKLYVDGSLDNFKMSSSRPVVSSCPLQIGGFDCSYRGQSLNAIVDELQIYDVALSDSQIKSLFEQQGT